MEAAMEKDLKSKLDQIVQDLFVKSIQIILQSRIPVTGQSSAESKASSSSSSSSKRTRWDHRFNLALAEFHKDVDALAACKKSGFRSVVLDVLLVQSQHQQTESGFKHGTLQNFWKRVLSHQENRKSVLERWILQYVSHDNAQNDTSGIERMIVKVYKSTMILLRSLVSMTRLLPAYQAFQLANSSSYGKFFGLSYRFLPLPRPLPQGEGIRMKSYKFTPIESPFGKICLSVDYRSLIASDFNVSSGSGLPRVMTDYYTGGPTTDQVKTSSDRCYSTNMMLNFGGSLPITQRVSPALPHDSYMDKKLTDCKCATSPRHSYLQRALQTIPLSGSRSCRCIKSSPQEQFHHAALFTRQTESVARSFLGGNAVLMFSGAHDYWSEAEVAPSLPFAIDNDGCVNFSNSLNSNQSAQINEAKAKEVAAFQIPREAAIGAMVDLFKFAPPLRQFTTLDSSQDFLKLPKALLQKDGNIHTCPCKAQTSVLPMENSYLELLNYPKQGTPGSCSKITADQALKELDMYRDVKNKILSKRDNDIK
ncbi:hypothetical protein KI387_014166 [Taxus chinensis]|uniref:Autophagy-related protein 13 N-terminal domain-containing protein n=1 Tax=Taxus chinensis TaxID=29808 RepID=A0AA38CTT2_TAXCH|nr:hypothetical protein KI387_014166 [Taxus chinensis]